MGALKEISQREELEENRSSVSGGSCSIRPALLPQPRQESATGRACDAHLIDLTSLRQQDHREHATEITY